MHAMVLITSSMWGVRHKKNHNKQEDAATKINYSMLQSIWNEGHMSYLILDLKHIMEALLQISTNI